MKQKNRISKLLNPLQFTHIVLKMSILKNFHLHKIIIAG
jgi:hypothetical protein